MSDMRRHPMTAQAALNAGPEALFALLGARLRDSVKSGARAQIG